MILGSGGNSCGGVVVVGALQVPLLPHGVLRVTERNSTYYGCFLFGCVSCGGDCEGSEWWNQCALISKLIKTFVASIAPRACAS